MPQQEVFFSKQFGDRLIEIFKTYDRQFAREAFENIDVAAQAYLWTSLGIDDAYDPTDLPPQHDPDSEDFYGRSCLKLPAKTAPCFRSLSSTRP